MAFWEDTVCPLVDMIAGEWNASLGAHYGVELRPDLDQVPAIVEKKQMQWAMLDATTSLTLNEKRAAMGYEPIKGGDEILVPMSSISLSDATGGLGDINIADAKALAYGMQARVIPIQGQK